MERNRIFRLTLTGLMTAFVCIATMVIRIPTPTNGYVNAGDGLILISGWLLGPGYGFFAAGVGSALADLLSGYGSYVPGTLLIKGLMAVLAAVLFAKGKGGTASRAVGAVSAEVWMVCGYFLYESTLLGYGLAAAASIFGNTVQGVFGVVLGMVLWNLLRKTGIANKLSE